MESSNSPTMKRGLPLYILVGLLAGIVLGIVLHTNYLADRASNWSRNTEICLSNTMPHWQRAIRK